MNTEISIDSLKVRIPIEKVEVRNLAFKNLATIDVDTGNIEDEFKENRVSHFVDGIKTSFGLETQVTAEQKTQDYLIILFNAKILMQDYFDGITSSNIETIYKYIISLDIAKFSYDDFLNGECTDVDYKQDLLTDSFDDIVKVMQQHTLSSKKKDYGYNAFSKPTNRGIEFGSRNKATPSKPFLKLYHKGLQLLHGMPIFYTKFLSRNGLDYSKIARLETTVKNKKHFKKLGIEDTALKSILSTSKEQNKHIMQNSIKMNLEPRMIVVKNNDNLTPSDTVYFNTIMVLLSKGLNYNLIRETLVQNIRNASSKTNVRKKLDRIYQSYARGEKMDKDAEHMNDFFSSIGWM